MTSGSPGHVQALSKHGEKFTGFYILTMVGKQENYAGW